MRFYKFDFLTLSCWAYKYILRFKWIPCWVSSALRYRSICTIKVLSLHFWANLWSISKDPIFNYLFCCCR